MLRVSALILLASVLPALAQTGEPSTVERCMDSWQRADSDNDGVVSTAEAQTASEAAFALMDANGDNRVSLEEWQACLSPEGAAIGTSPAAPGSGGN